MSQPTEWRWYHRVLAWVWRLIEPESDSESPEVPPCPMCGSEDVMERHHDGSGFAPECDFKECDVRGHVWDIN